MSWEIEVYAPGPPPPPPTPVSVNATASDTTRGSSVTTVSNSNLTVAVGTHTVLLAWLAVQPSVTGITVAWDPTGANQALTQIVSHQGDSNTLCTLWGLVAPVTGNKTLTASWTGSSACVLTAAAFDHVNQVGGGSSFANASFNTGTSNTTSLSVSAGPQDAVVDFTANSTTGNVSAPTQTQVFIDNILFYNSGGSYALNGPATFGWSLLNSVSWVEVGCSLVAG